MVFSSEKLRLERSPCKQVYNIIFKILKSFGYLLVNYPFVGYYAVCQFNIEYNASTFFAA